MKLLWILLGAAVMVQARPDWVAMVSGGLESETEFIVTEDGIKPNPKFVKQDSSSPVNQDFGGRTEDRKFEAPRRIVEAASEILSSTAGLEPKSSIINIDVTKPITAELSINFHQVQDPAPKPEPTCIDNWQPCRGSNTPCCGQQPTEDGTLGPKYFTCFEFSRQGVCVPLHHIDNLELYARLVDQLNGTNFAELDDQYWKSIPGARDSSNY